MQYYTSNEALLSPQHVCSLCSHHTDITLTAHTRGLQHAIPSQLRAVQHSWAVLVLQPRVLQKVLPRPEAPKGMGATTPRGRISAPTAPQEQELDLCSGHRVTPADSHGTALPCPNSYISRFNAGSNLCILLSISF